MKGHENKKKYPNHRSWGKNGKREKKMHAMRGSKDLYRYDNVTLSPLLLPARVTNRSHSTYGSSARSDSHRVVFCPNSVISGWKN
jgi:hypothetical protein